METKSGRGKQATNRNKLLIAIAAGVVVLLLLLLGALLLFPGSDEPTPTDPSSSMQESSKPTETNPPSVDVPVKVWDMEALPENLIDAGMAYANSSNTIYGNLRIGAGKGKGLGGSTAFAYTFVGNYSDADVYVMSPASLKGQNLVSDWSNGEMLWFWVNGTELLQNVRLEITINGKYMPIGPTYYTIDKEGQCVPVGTIPEGWGTTTTRGRIRLNMGWEGWIGIPIEETYGEIKNLTSIQFIVGNSTIKAGNILYLDEFWLTKMGEVPPLTKEELTYSAMESLMNSLTHGKIWDVELPEVGTEVGTVATTAGRNNATSKIYANKGVNGSKAWGYVLTQVENTNSQNVDMSAIALAKYGVETRAIRSASDMLWFYVDSDLSAGAMIHLQLNGIFMAREGIYTISVKNGQPVITPVGSYDSKGSVNGVSVVPNNGGPTGTYGRIEISAGWSGWIGIPVGNFCVNSDGTPADIPAGKTGNLTMRLYAPANSFQVGDAIYFDEFWMTEGGKMPELSKTELCYGYTASIEKPTVGYGQIWDGGDKNNVAVGTQIGSVGSQSDRNVVTTPVVAGKGHGGSKAMSYVLGSVNKTNGNNLTMISGDLSEFGYKIATVGGLDDILWIWVDSLQDADQLLHLQVNSVQTHLKQAPIYSIAPDADGNATIVEVPLYDSAASCINGVGVVPQGGYARIKLCKGWSGWIGIPVGHFSVDSTGAASNNPMEKISSITIRNFASAGTLTVGDAIIFDELWLTKKETMPAMTNEQLLYGYTEVEKPEVSEDGQIWDSGDDKQVANGTTAGSVGGQSDRTTINNYITSGFGVNNTNALAYYLAGNFKTNGNNMTLNAGDLAEMGFNVTNFSEDKSDILWFWVRSGQAADQLLHIQLNTTNVFLAQKSIYTIVDENGAPVMKEVLFNDLTGGVGVTDSNWNGAGKYARIYIKGGWSGWVGIPVSNFSITSGGDAAELPGTGVSQLTIRNYVKSAANLQQGVGVLFDEFWLTGAGKMPALTNAELLWTSTESIDPSEPDNTEGTTGSESTENTESSESTESTEGPVEPTETHQTLLQNFESLTAGTAFGTVSGGSYNPMSAIVNADNGIKGGKGLSYAYTSGNINNAKNVALATKDNQIPSVQIAAASDILWFWVYSQVAEDRLLHVQLGQNGATSHLAKDSIYTIVDENGTPTIKEIAFNDLTGGVGITDSNWNGAGAYGRVFIKSGWSGWIGIPVEHFCGNNTTAPAAGGTLDSITWRMYKTSDRAWAEGDVLYFDEFWLTSAGKMPNLTNEELLYTYAPPVVTEINLANRYQNGMIFQQNKPWIVNGTGVIGETVTVELINKENATVQTKTATVDSDSNWTVTMDGVAGSYDAYTVKVTSGNNSKSIENVVFGEVWAAGGQSNMAYTIYRDPSGDTVMTEADMNALQAELAAYENAGYIRFFMSGSSHLNGLVAEDVVGTWGNGTNWDAVKSCSATAFYFAKNLEAVLNVPVGVVVAANGGTNLSAWVDPAIAQADTEFYDAVNSLGYVGSSAAQRAMLGGWFNSRVVTWSGFEVNGFIWYQGEQDSGKSAPQKLGYDVLVDSWSKVFNSEATIEALPLVAIQIAPYAASNPSVSKMEETNELNAAMLEGVKALSSKATVVQIYDLFIDITNHHPQHKPQLGARASVAALNLVYGKGTITSGPVLESADYSIAGQITLTLADVGTGLKYIQLTEEANKRYEPAGFAMPTDMYVDAINGFSVWTGTEYVDITEAQFVGHNQIVLMLPEGVVAAGVSYGRSMDILTANVYNNEGFPMVPFDHVRPGFSITHKTPLWNADSTDEVVIKDNNASSGRNTSKISIGKFGIGGSNALKYELVTAGNERTHTWNSGDLGAYGFRTDVSIAAEDDIFWFYLEANVSTVQRLQTYNFNPNGKSIYTLVGTTGNMTLVEVPFGGDDPVEGLALLAHNNTQAQLQIEPGFKGWIGFPVDVLGKNVGDCFSTFSVILLQKKDEDPAGYAGQQVGDHVIFDEFWLTSAGEYPTVATGEQSVKLRTSLQNFEEMADDHSFTINAPTNTTYKKIKPYLASAVGLNGSKALAYQIDEVVASGNMESKNFQLKASSGEINTNIILDSTDLFWFWIDSDLSGDRILHIQLNNTQYERSDALDGTVYTIGDTNEDGVAELITVPYVNDRNQVTGMGAVNYNMDGNHASRARIKVSAGWSGWVGIPVGHFSGLTVGGELNSIQIRAIGSQTESPVSVGDILYFDEFWMTPAGMMPKLSDEKLLWNADPVETPDDGEEEEPTKATLLQNFENVADDYSFTINAATNATYKKIKPYLATAVGLGDSKALAYEINEVVASGNMDSKNFQLQVSKGELNDNVIEANTDIFWFWIDSHLSGDRIFHIQLNNTQYERSETFDGTVYTIGDTNEDGIAELISVPYVNDRNQVTGMGAVNYNMDGSNASRARIKVSAGWSGWVGIPVGHFSGLAVGGSLNSIQIRAIGSQTESPVNVGEVVYFDEFWLTSANTMPGLTDDQLLNKVTSVPIWTFNDGTEVSDAFGKSWLTNLTEASTNSTLSIVDGKGLNGKSALKITADAAVNNTSWYHVNLASQAAELGTVNSGKLTEILGDHSTDELMIWIYFDGSDLKNNVRLSCGFEDASATTGLWTYSVQYYIDANGSVQSMALGSNGAGAGVVNSGARGRMTIDAGFVGWIGIVVSDLGSSSQADLSTLGEFCFMLCCGIDRNNSNSVVALEAGSALYIGDMWLSVKGADGNWTIPAPAVQPAN